MFFVRAILENRVFHLKKGYVGVVSRSQSDIEANKCIEKALTDEEHFFLNSPYKHMKMGAKYLQQVLNIELGSHIKAKIPEIRSELLKKCKEVEDDLDNLGYEEQTTADLSRTVIKLLYDFVEKIFSNIDGSGDEVNMEILIGGAKINRSFYRDFNKLFKDIDTASNLDDKQIGKAIANSHGVKNPLLVPVRAFDKIVQSLLDQYEVPIQKCVQHVREILEGVIQSSMFVLTGYPRLKSEVSKLVIGEMDKNAKETINLLLLHVQAQKAFMNTRHPYFKKPSYTHDEGKEDNGEDCEEEYDDDDEEEEDYPYEDDIEHMTEMVDRYMEIEDTNIRDTIPKYIMLKLGKIL